MRYRDRLALGNDVLDGAIAAGGGAEGFRVGFKGRRQAFRV